MKKTNEDMTLNEYQRLAARTDSHKVGTNPTLSPLINRGIQDFIDAIKLKWNLKNAKIYNINDYEVEEIGAFLTYDMKILDEKE